MTIQHLKLSSIRLDGKTQSRAALDPPTVERYAAAMLDGATFPPVCVFQDGPNLWLADGFHRVAAAGRADLQELAAEVRPGTVRDARLHGLGANKHGLHMTTLDKRAAVAAILADPEWCTWSDKKIATHVDVSRPFVAKMRTQGGATLHPLPAAPWTPSENESLIGHMATSVNGTEMLAYVVPAVPHEGETRTFYWLVVCILRDGDDEEGDVIFTKRPLAAAIDGEPDVIGHFLRMTNGFVPEEAEWERHQVTEEDDEEDTVFMNYTKRWSWPHGAFGSKREDLEVMQWWAFPKDSAAYKTGRARAEAEGKALLASQEAETEDDEAPVPDQLRTAPAGNAS